jgi:hypothetical protein
VNVESALGTIAQHKLIGRTSTNVAALMQAQQAVGATGVKANNELLLTERDNSAAVTGVLVVNHAGCRTIVDYTMMDYIKGGCEINVMFAIDFTVW